MFKFWKEIYIAWKMKEAAAGKVIRYIRRRNIEHVFKTYKENVEAL
jgi:hypothetical protein